MSKKITLRIDEDLYVKLCDEFKRFGYRSFSSYISKILKERNIVEISGGNDLAAVLHQIKTINSGDLRLAERRNKLCQLYDSLMIEIENLRNCVKS